MRAWAHTAAPFSPPRVTRQARRDALVEAPTGSGKTLAYLAPIVDELAQRPQRVSRAEGTLGVVVCPTRELALQVENVLAGLLRRFFWLVRGAGGAGGGGGGGRGEGGRGWAGGKGPPAAVLGVGVL